MSNQDSPAFRGWFKQSKVIDANGQPKVVYHGTRGDFTAFSEDRVVTGIFGDGFYFSDRTDVASRYAGGEGGSILPVYLAIQNPVPHEVLNEILEAEDNGELRMDELQDEIIGRGYDGIISEIPSSQETIYVAFYPEQIKSAVGNFGSFNPDSPSLTDHPDEPELEDEWSGPGF